VTAPSESTLLLAIDLGEKRIVSIFCGRADGNFGISDSVFLMDKFFLPSQFKTLLSHTRWKIGLKIRWKIQFLKLSIKSSTKETESRLGLSARRRKEPGRHVSAMRRLAILLLLGMVLVVSGFHATLLLKSSNQKYCSSRGRNSNVRALHLNMASDPHELVNFQAFVKRLVALEAQVTDLNKAVERIPDLEKEVKRIPVLEKEVKRIPDLEKAVKRIPDLEKEVKRIPDLDKEVKRIPDLKTEITTVSGEVQTLAGNRAIIVASQALLINIGVQPRIKVQSSKYFSNALNNRQNPDFSTTLKGVFVAVDYNSKWALSARFDRMVDARNLGAHPSDLGYLGDEAAKLVKILQRRVDARIALDTDEETALLVLEKYKDLANAVNRDKIV
jgi:hypothetical protein